MKKDTALVVSGFIFAIVALAHVVRFFLKTEIIISGHVLSMEASLIAFVIAGLLSIWMFMASKS